ncbi:cyclin-dependent kinase regulatory subunit protein, partial [Cystoisospora suis]
SVSFFLLYFLICCLSVEGASPEGKSSSSPSPQFSPLASFSCDPNTRRFSSLLPPCFFFSSPSPSSSFTFSSTPQDSLLFPPSSPTTLPSRRSSLSTSFSPSLFFFSPSSSLFSGLKRREEKDVSSSFSLPFSSLRSSSSSLPRDSAFPFLPGTFRSNKKEGHLSLPRQRKFSTSEERRRRSQSFFSTLSPSLLSSCPFSFILSCVSSSYRSSRASCSLLCPTSSSSPFPSSSLANNLDYSNVSSLLSLIASPSSSSSSSSSPPCEYHERISSQSLHATSSLLLRRVSSSSIFPSYASQHRFSCHTSFHPLSSFKSPLNEKTREDDRNKLLCSSLLGRKRSYGDVLSPSSLKAFSSSFSFSPTHLVHERNREQVQDDAPSPFFLCLAERRRYEDGDKKRKTEKIHLSILSSSRSAAGDKAQDVQGDGEETKEKENKKKKKSVEDEEQGKTKKKQRRRRKEGEEEGQEEAEEEGEGRTRDGSVDRALHELREFFESVREKERRRRAFLKERAEKVPHTLRSAYLDKTQVYLPHRYQHHRNPLRRRRVLRCFPPPRTRRFKLRVTPHEEGKEKKETEEREEEEEEEEITFDPEDMDRFLDPPKPLSAYSWPDGCYLRIAYSGNRADDMDETGRRIIAAIESAGSSYLYSMPARLPIIRRRFSVPKSPHKHRKAIEQFEICERRRIIDLHRRDLLAIAERQGERGPRRWGRMEWPSRSLSTRVRGRESGREEDRREAEEREFQFDEEEGEGTREDVDVMKEEEEEEVDILEEHEEEMERTRHLDDHLNRERLERLQGGEWRKVEKKKIKKEPHEATVKALLTIDLPELVHYNLRYEPYRLPLKGREIVARLGYQPKWTSKYFEYLQVRKKHLHE